MTDLSVGSVIKVKSGDTAARYHTPNDITKGRAQTLFTKEPITIKWIEGMAPGEILFDVGANVGMYSVWAAKRGVQVYAFEPEAGNYDLLCRNLALNDLAVPAYCLAVSDRTSIDLLHLSQREAGHSCHSFGAAVNFDLRPRKGPTQGAVAMPIDELVRRGLPQPDHIKIDVDGFEHKVIAGARKTLENVKSVLVELNPTMKEHQMVLNWFRGQGWYLDPHQVEQATRKGGAFKGYAEHLFHKFSPVAAHTLERIAAAEVQQHPFPHLYVENVFDERMYAALLSQLPGDGAYAALAGYPERGLCYPSGPFWADVARFINSGAVQQALCEKLSTPRAEGQVRLIRDRAGYALGPHTDTPSKVLSALFYLAKDESLEAHGTSLYARPGFTCAGDQHHGFAGFTKVATMPFKPNTLFAFAKSDTSFHGVEPFPGPGVRDALLLDIQRPR